MPSELRRKLFRLSALLEIGDDEFASFRDQTRALAKEISQQIEQGKSDINLDLVSLREYLASASEETKTLAAYALQAGFKEVINDRGDQDLSGLLQVLRACDVTAVGSLEKVLQSSESWAKQYSDFSVVLLRSDFMLVSEKNHVKMHKNQWLWTPLSALDIPCRATNRGKHSEGWGSDACAVT